jgi:hypothetical protein
MSACSAHARRTLASVSLNHKTMLSRCYRLFGDILQSNHSREIQIPQTRQVGEETKCRFVDAQGAMLVLQRVGDFARQGVLAASCGERTLAVEKTLRDLCVQKLGDMCLQGFDAKRRLADIKKEQDLGCGDVQGALGDSHADRLWHSSCIRTPTDLVRMPVGELDGINNISRLLEDGKLLVLAR